MFGCFVEYDRSSSSVAWDRFLHSSLVSGEGLLAVGGDRDSVRKDMRKIHQENIDQLSKMSEEEIVQEQNKIKQQLGTLKSVEKAVYLLY